MAPSPISFGLPFSGLSASLPTLRELLRNPQGTPGAPPDNCACWGSVKLMKYRKIMCMLFTHRSFIAYMPEDGRQQYDIPLRGEVPNPTQIHPRSSPRTAEPIFPYGTHLFDTFCTLWLLLRILLDPLSVNFPHRFRPSGNSFAPHKASQEPLRATVHAGEV